MESPAKLHFTRDIPVRHEVDILVVGGGPAGVAASVAGARQGREVFLAEAHSCFGGMGTAGLVPIFMQFADGVNFLAGGVGREVHDKLFHMGGAGPDDSIDQPHGILCIRAEALKRLYDDLLAEAGVHFALHTNLIGVEMDGDRVAAAVMWAKSGLFAVKAKVYIDSTGDGDLCAWAGAPFEKGDENGDLMPGTLCSLWSDIDWQAVREKGPSDGQGGGRLAKAFQDKVFTVEDRHLSGMFRVGETSGGGNIGHNFGVDGTDERSLTEALVWGRKLVLEYERYYKEYLEGFEKMELQATGSLMGLRETRRIMGDYVLNVEDFKNRAGFDDEIGRYSYPVDIHPARPSDDTFAEFQKEFHSLRYKDGESYGIPYRSLVPRGLANVLVAGRCVSSDRYIQGSIRVMPGCYITGQATGVAAALAVEKDTDTRGVPVADLQARLRELGAFLPNSGKGSA